MSKENRVRVGNAFRAMKEIGISDDKVKPVLKNLLKLYDKNWELIESENYRALADAIFEREEAEENKRSKKTVDNEDAVHSKKTVNNDKGLEEETQEESRRPVKRLRLRYQDGQSCSSAAATASGPRVPLIVPKDEPTELPDTFPLEVNASQVLAGSPQPSAENAGNDPQLLRKNKGKQPISPQPLVAREVCDPCQPSSVSSPQATMPRDRGTESVCPKSSSGKTRSLPNGSPQSTCIKEWKVVRDTVPVPKKKRAANYPLIIPKDEPDTDDTPQFPVPLAVVHPEPCSGGESSERNGTCRELSCLESLATPSTNEKERIDGTDTPNEARMSGELAVTAGQCASNLVIASSPSGEVKIFLSCNMALLRPDFDIPSLGTVLQFVEEKYLRSYKTLDPKISLMNIMNEICQSFLNIRSDKGLATINAHPTPNDDLCDGGLHLSPLTGANDRQSNTELTLPKTPPVTPCNGTSDGCHSQDRDGGDDHAEETNCLSLVVVDQPHVKIHSEEANDLSLVAVDQPEIEIHAEESNGMSLVVVDQPQEMSEMIMPLNDVFDIAKGQEKDVITLVNEVNNEPPPSFHYIPQNVVFQNAYVNISLAHIGDNSCCSACSGNCLSSSAPCACAHVVRGDFAYTKDGLVNEELLTESISMNRDPKKHSQIFCKECPVEKSKNEDIPEPCKGHLVRKFIKECWVRCGCNKQCGNRVVQRGITRKLQVFMTPEGKGWGLRTLENLPQGAFVCEFVGEVLTNSEFFRRILRGPKREKQSYSVVLDADWGAEEVLKDKEALCLDATYYGNVARFINHRCYDSNLVEIPVEVETSDHHYYRLAFFTTRKIMAMEELTWDYGIDFDDHDYPIKAFSCECGSKFCRNIRRSTTISSPNQQVWISSIKGSRASSSRN